MDAGRIFDLASCRWDGYRIRPVSKVCGMYLNIAVLNFFSLELTYSWCFWKTYRLTGDAYGLVLLLLYPNQGQPQPSPAQLPPCMQCNQPLMESNFRLWTRSPRSKAQPLCSPSPSTLSASPWARRRRRRRRKRRPRRRMKPWVWRKIKRVIDWNVRCEQLLLCLEKRKLRIWSYFYLY